MTYAPYLHKTYTCCRSVFCHGCGTFFRMILTVMQCPGFMDKRLDYTESVWVHSYMSLIRLAFYHMVRL